jgi:hypothetical protein
MRLIQTVAPLVVDGSTAPVLHAPTTAAAPEARTAEIVGRDVHADGKARGDDDVESQSIACSEAGNAANEHLPDRPRRAHEHESEDLGLLAPHGVRPCTNDAAFAHSPRSASSSFDTHPDFTARRSSSRSVVWSISGPSVLKLKRTLWRLNVAMN